MNILHKYKLIILFGLLLFQSLTYDSFSQLKSHSLLSKEVIETIKTRVDSGRASGITIATVDSIGNFEFYSYGYLSNNSKKEIDEYSIFNIGSVTKIFTTLLFAILVDNKEINLDDPIQDYLPEGIRFPICDSSPITLQDLATHSSGLPENMFIADYENPFSQTKEEVYRYIDTCTLLYCPGDSTIYSNIGIALLGLIIEDFKNDSYENLVQKYILDELELNNTYFNVPDSKMSNRAEGHLNGSHVNSRNFDAMKACGIMKSCSYDLINFISFQIGHKPTSISDAITMTQKRYVKTFTEGRGTIGMSWYIMDRDGNNFYNHGGAVIGYKAFVGFDLQKKIGVVILTNSFCYINDIGYHVLNNKNSIKSFYEMKDFNY
jgi:serine-type D-Ala-D-Ala carboxypeptidase/endopeptidase